MAKKVSEYQPLVGLSVSTCQIRFKFEDGSTQIAGHLSPDHFCAIMAVLQVSAEAYVKIDEKSGAPYITTRPDQPGPM